MGKYNTTTTKAANTAKSAVKTKTKKTATTHGGKTVAARDARSELFLATVSTLGANSFYEDAMARESRVATLSRKVAVKHPKWTREFITYLRDTAQIRSAAIVVAVEGAKARAGMKVNGDEALVNWGRQFVNSALSRADEPGEALAYYLARYGKRIPASVKKGVADGANRLYNEYSVLKYDTDTKGIRFADVIQLVHPTPVDDKQAAVFKYALNRRYGNTEVPAGLDMIKARKALMDLPVNKRIAKASPEKMKAAGLTWEARSSWGPMDAKAWGNLIKGDSIGYMAMLRNLRNFTEAGITPTMVKKVRDILSDPERVAKSRQLPFRFYSAYRANQDSTKYMSALEDALEASLANVPELTGKTLVLVDTSGSMTWSSDRSGITLMDKAALFGSAVALRADKADLVQFGSSSETVRFKKGDSVLPLIGKFRCLGGTSTAEAVRQHFKGHDRVIIITDEQDNGYGNPLSVVPSNVPVYTWNLEGYRAGHSDSGSANRHTFGGLTDTSFKLIPLLEAGQDADWETLFGTSGVA